MMKWTKIEKVNEWTGAVHVRYIAEVMTTDRVASSSLQVQEIGGRWCWSTSTIVDHKPGLTRYGYGSIAVTPYSLAVAKSKATRVAMKTIRRVELLGRSA
jgi:hypothetical protein